MGQCARRLLIRNCLGHDPWINWASIEARLDLMQRSLLMGLLQNPEPLKESLN